MRTMAAGQFKAKCLGLLDEVKTKRESVIVTKHGQPWAKLVPLDMEDDPLSAFRFSGKIEIVGDIMAPLYTDEENEAFFERSANQLR
jgi:prevent-host-death family protein